MGETLNSCEMRAVQAAEAVRHGHCTDACCPRRTDLASLMRVSQFEVQPLNTVGETGTLSLNVNQSSRAGTLSAAGGAAGTDGVLGDVEPAATARTVCPFSLSDLWGISRTAVGKSLEQSRLWKQRKKDGMWVGSRRRTMKCALPKRPRQHIEQPVAAEKIPRKSEVVRIPSQFFLEPLH